MIKAAALYAAHSIITDFENSSQFAAHVAWGVNRNQLIQQLLHRISHGQYSWPDQGDTSLCGPAAFMFCLIHDRPDLYVGHIIDLWTGRPATLGQRSIKPSAQVRTTAETRTETVNPRTGAKEMQTVPQAARINAVDWISMASLRNDSPSLIPFSSYDHPSAMASAITRPAYLKAWFNEVDSTTLLDNTNEIFPMADWKELLELAPYQPSAWVVMLVSAAMFGGSGSTYKNHWVVLNGPITVNGRPISGYSANQKPDLATASVQARIFTWGDEAKGLASTTALPHLSHFLKCFHGGIAFSSIP
ncbi:MULTISPECIES: hypothetical protein [unclassified Acidovorax]|uniref:hypothetical protein n=1 Tax=unclassified Acidovorax TaxID=2684926 RepID=UPI000B0847A1|nr:MULTISPECIES: hypothetical protein [unclassified Acidovorax]